MAQKKTTTSPFGSKERVNHDSSLFYASRLYSALDGDNAAKSLENTTTNAFPLSYLDAIINHTSQNMKELPDNSLHLMITSPPYNVSKEYDKDLSLKEYLAMLKEVFCQVYRVLVNGGRACVNVANLGRKPYIPLASFITTLMQEIGFVMRGEIIWDKGASSTPSCAWGSWQSASNPILRDVHEYILVFSKGDYKRELTKQEKETKKNTITKENFISWTKSIWQMNTESAKRIGHPAPFPVELPRRLIELYSFIGDIVLDPFMGSGSTAVAAIKTKRHFVGFEISSEYVDLCNKRIKEAKEKEARLDF